MVQEVNKQRLRKVHQILRLNYPVDADNDQSSRNEEKKRDYGKNSTKSTNLDFLATTLFIGTKG
jgi:hypothetical protein